MNSVEQWHGGALPDRLIPDKTQQQWTIRRDVDKARRRNGAQRIGPLVNESWLLFIYDMSSYLDLSRSTVQQWEGSIAM
ncbi:hypothetical protein Syun_013770 [Stephania yunnanensis]|uniref:Uncharacterized protein n=1 Tax=Stephania yunnanensis TaxID=152371 RepID=A0AAP0PB58_9MAGN